jgi:hypothetical protein
MKLTAVAHEERVVGSSEVETVPLSTQQVTYLEKLCGAMEPSFGRPHLIRTLLDCIEKSGIDLSEASSEQELARLASISLNRAQGKAERQPEAIAPLSAVSATARPSGRRSYRSNLPVRGRHRSGKPPRSNRG